MDVMAAGTRRACGYALTALVLVAAWLVAAAVPAPASSPSTLAPALESAVRLQVILSWTDGTGPVDVSGSGWTRSCTPTERGFEIVVATAGHVIDIEELQQSIHPGPSAPSVKVVMAYRDGHEFVAGREALHVHRERDYGEVRLLLPLTSSPSPPPYLPRPLPVGDPDSVYPGAPLVAVGSPGPIPFGVFPGHLILSHPIPLHGAPATHWLSTIPVGPGLSGAPVLDEQGQVVATVIGFVTWPWGGSASVLVPLDRPEKKGRG